jgi:hypothetical protein
MFKCCVAFAYEVYRELPEPGDYVGHECPSERGWGDGEESPSTVYLKVSGAQKRNGSR